MKKNNNKFLIIIFAVMLIAVFFLPKIYDFIETLKMPKVESLDNENKEEVKKIDSELLSDLHYPIMRNSIYDKNTYYSLEKFQISDMSNNDILYNAFLDIHEGYMTSLNSKQECTNNSMEFDKKYIELRIKNILGKNIDYTLDSFYVPEDSNSNYTGEWIYNSNNSTFIYKGLCKSLKSNTTYYDLKQMIKAEYNKNDIYVYYYIGFAKVEGNNYTIYSDVQMTNELKSGTISDVKELDDIFKDINDKDKKIYRYIFKNNICSYNDYCVFEGEWINEL